MFVCAAVQSFAVNNVLNFSSWWKDNKPCTMIVVKVKIVNSFHSFKKSCRCSVSIGCDRARHSLTDALDATELVSLNTNAKSMVPSGKCRLR
jgi:hypothetical protein